ncbi:hypothetical protein [Halorussus amylolyticus]|uniref:hypothetical protein n=1 Tax=Halorussus amylolyticus TaxID=1126242 RepID=UPI00138EFD64|nr:hypothetical protein [Halorussus amylolyticus]
MIDTEPDTSEQNSRENPRVTKDDVIVQTPNGERYESHLINATGLPREIVEERTND